MSNLLVSVCLLLGAVLQAAPAKPDAKSSRQLYEQAAKAIASADLRAAIIPLEQLIEDQPNSSLACIAAVHLAECYVASNREQDAAKLFEKWSDRIAVASKSTKLDANLDAHHFRVWLQAAKRIGRDSDSIQSLEALAKRLESRNDSDKKQFIELLVDSRVELARRLSASGELDLAAEQLNRLAESATEASSETRLLIAMLHQQLGNHAQAQKVLETLVDGDSQTPGLLLANLELASYALQEHKLESAAALLKPIVESHAQYHGLDQDSECRFRMVWSELELAQGNAARSLEVLPGDDELGKLDERQQVAIRFSRAEAAAQAGKTAQALQDLEWLSRFAEQMPADPDWAVSVKLRQSELLLKTKEYAKLVTQVDEAKNRFASFERLHEFDYLLARASMQQIDFDQARIHLKAITEAKGKSVSAAARAQWMLGETYFLEQNFGQAIREYKPVTLLDESQPWQTLALMQTAKCFELLNQTSEALETYRRVVKVTKDEKIRQEASARIEVVELTASRGKPPSLR